MLQWYVGCYYGMVSDLIASVSVDLIHRDVDKDSWEFCISYLSDTIPHPQACGNVRESIHIYYGTVCSWAHVTRYHLLLDTAISEPLFEKKNE